MNAGPRLPQYWLVPALIALLAVPAAWATVAVIAIALGMLAFPAMRRALPAAGARHAGADGRPAADGTRLGTDRRGHEVLLSDRELAAHGLIVGASGAGKSTTMLTILTDHVRRGHPVVAIDLKGSPSFAGRLEAAAHAAGRPFRRWTLDGPSTWNPLQHGNPTELKDKLIATERFTEPHYQRAAERYIQIALQALQAARPGVAPTLDQMVEVMDPRRLAVLSRMLPDVQGRRLQDYLATISSDQLSAVRGLGTRLALITESHAGRFLSPAGGQADRPIDLRAALAGDEVVLFSLNSSTYGKLAAQIGTLVVQDLTTAAGHRLEHGSGLGQPALVAVDEFSALGSDNILHLLARGREAGLPVLLATQELADLDRAGPGLRDQVLGIVGLKIAHRQDVPASAQTVAQLGGTVKAWEETRQLGGGYFGRYPTARGTRRVVEQFRVHPNEIKELAAGDAVLISKLPRASVRTVRIAPPRQERGLER